jgi:hypothetical protein
LHLSYQSLYNRHQISVVILNWARPNNVRKIVDALVKYDEIGEVLILMVNSNVSADFTYNHSKVRQIVDHPLYKRFGIAYRFHACAHQTHFESVLIQDDDLLFTNDDIRHLIAAPRRPACFDFAARLHRYSPVGDPNIEGPPLMCLGRVMLVDRMLCNEFFRFSPLMDSFFIRNPFHNKHWHGQDIFIGLVHLYLSNGSSPYFLHEPKHIELPDTHAIHRMSGHFEHRRALVEEATRILNFTYILYYDAPHRESIHKRLQSATLSKQL